MTHKSTKLLAAILVITQIAMLPLVAFNTSLANSSYNQQEILLSASDIEQSNNNCTTIWDAMRAHFSLNNYDNQPAVKQAILWYTSHPTDLNRMFKQAAPYLAYIYKVTQQKNLPAELALLPMVESSFIIRAHSSAGATGLWQLRAGTAHDMGLKINAWYDGRNDIVASTNAALKYIVSLHNYFNDWLLALAAYNDGVGLIHKDMQYNLSHNHGAGYWQLHIPKETRAYLPRLLAFAAIMRDPAKYHLQLPNIPMAPLEKTVTVHGQVNLINLAYKAHLAYKEIYTLNPAWRYPLTDPHAKHYQLLLPIKNINNTKWYINHKRSRLWLFKTFNTTKSVKNLAYKYNTSASTLKLINNLHNANYIKAKQLVLLPQTTITKAKILRSGYNLTASSQLDGTLHYPVSKNDTLDSIARKFHVTVDDIIKWNHMKMPATLHVLDVLKIQLPKNTPNDNNLASIIDKINS